MIKLEPILDMDLSEEPMPEPMMDFIGNRLEYVQRKRLRLLQDIEKSYTYKDIAGDEGLSITYTSTLRDLEKQELAKYKTKREEEAGDKDARAALFAAEVINEFVS